MRNIKLTVSYDGTRYLGWQKTKTGPSIEECLEKAAGQILQEKVSLQAASRTDRGVHAEGQVVNFVTSKPDLDLRRLQHGINALLPDDISIRALEDVTLEFHPTLQAKGKEYQYQICNSPVQLPFFRHISWHYPLPLLLDQMREASLKLIGQHDFSAFCNELAIQETNPICTLTEIIISPVEKGRLLISISGDHFLYKMVRNLVGTLVYVGAGKILPSSLPSILEKKDRTQAGITAPAHGLFLKQVFY